MKLMPDTLKRSLIARQSLASGQTFTNYYKFMKYITLIILSVVSLLSGQVTLAAPGQISTNGILLAWDYPASVLSTNQVLFKLYSTTNLTSPQSSWPLVKSIRSTNGIPVGTNLSFITAFPMQAEARYFVMTASNFWGESVFSSVAATPSAPRFDVPLSIGLAP